MQQADEQRLIARVLDGHAEDYGLLMERHGAEVFRLVARLPQQLPSNFAYNTLRRIEREQKARERREQVAVACAIGLVALLGLSALFYYYATPLLSALLLMTRQTEGIGMLPALTFCAVFLTLLNHYLRRKFA